jgi:hypothetical protein
MIFIDKDNGSNTHELQGYPMRRTSTPAQDWPEKELITTGRMSVGGEEVQLIVTPAEHD